MSAPSPALSCTPAPGKRARLLSALSALQPGSCPGPWLPRTAHTPAARSARAAQGERSPASPGFRRFLQSLPGAVRVRGGAVPRSLRGGGPWGRAGPGTRRALRRAARRQAPGRPGGGARLPARGRALPGSGCEAREGAERRGRRASGPCPPIRPGPPPPCRPRCEPVCGVQSPPQRPPASRARARPSRGPVCRGVDAWPWSGSPAPRLRCCRNGAAAGLPPATAARGCCSPASGCCC